MMATRNRIALTSLLIVIIMLLARAFLGKFNLSSSVFEIVDSVIGFLFFLALLTLLFQLVMHISGKLAAHSNILRNTHAPKRPRIITIIAFLNFLWCLSFFSAFKKDYAFMFGIVLDNNIAIIYHVILAILGVYLGIGFLRLSKRAWYIWMAGNLILLTSNFANFILIKEIQILKLGATDPGTAITMYKTVSIISILYIMGLLFCVYKNKKSFGIQKQNTKSE